jgi:hypothetical protein
MAATTYADAAALFGSRLPRVSKAPRQPSRFGDLVIVAFLLAQACDGIFTYVGVADLGISVEMNPIIAGLMIHLGHGLGLLFAKITAVTFGICLHLLKIHSAVAMLTALYATAAIAPWVFILFV